MSFGPELLGGRRKKKDRGDFLRQAFHHLVGRTGVPGCPFEVMGFVDDQEVPIGIKHLGVPFRGTGQVVQAYANNLTVEKGVGVRVGAFDRLAAFFVEETSQQVKPTHQLDEPLVHQGFRKDDQGALGSSGQMEAVKNQTGFDGFSQAYFIGEENPWLQATGYFLGKVELMFNQIDASTSETAVGGFAEFGLPIEGFLADLEEVRVVQLPAHQAIEGAGKTDIVGQGGFGDPLPFHLVMQ